MKPFHCLFAALHRRRSGRRKKKARDDAANDGAVEGLILRQIREHRIAAAAAHRKLDRALAQTFFHFIKIDIVPTAGSTDDHDRSRSEASPPQRRQFLATTNSGSLTAR